jgi:hypothetical protein
MCLRMIRCCDMYFSLYFAAGCWTPTIICVRLLVAEPAALSLHHLIRDYIDIDFTPLQSQFQTEGWSSLDDLDHDQGKMMKVCLLHYNGDMATTFRYIGGPLTMEVHDTTKILAELKPILKADTYVQVERVYTEGAPAYMVAASTDANLRNAVQYGNHPSLALEPEKTLFCYARLSFGGNYCPPNWEALAIARMETALHLWQQPDTIERAAPFLPPITFAAPSTPEEVAAFVQTNLDEFVLSVFDADGK